MVRNCRKMCRGLDIVADIKKERCEWIGHLERKKVFESKMEGRRIGKSSLTWLDDAEKVKVKVER